MNFDHNKALVRGYLTEVVNNGNMAAFDSYFASDVVFNFGKNVRQQLAGMQVVRKAFPDHHLIIEDQIAIDDRVVTRVTFEGTHQREFNGIAATGRQLRYPGIAIDRIADGKVVEMWHVASALGLFDQICGALSGTSAK